MWIDVKVASSNLNSVRSRLTHVTAWLKVREPDVLLLQELKGTEFPSEAFKSLGYESVAVTQKAYNGVAVLLRHPMKTIAKALFGDDSDSHARFLEVIIRDIRIVNIYVPNGNPFYLCSQWQSIGSDKFAYKLVVSQFEISTLGGEQTSGYWSHRQCDTQIVSNLTVRRRLKLF